MLKLLRGVGIPPFITGTARGIVEAGVFAGILELLALASSADAPAWVQMLVPLLIAGFGAIKGIIDQIDPAKKRAP